MSKKRILLTAGVSLLILWVAVCAYTVTRSSIYSFQQFLFVTQSKINVSRLFLSFIFRHSIFLLDFMAGVCFLAICLFSSMSGSSFIKCADVLFISGGLAETTWNLRLFFNTTTRSCTFWLRSHNSFLILFAVCVFSIILPWFPIGASVKRICRNAVSVLTAAAVILIWTLAPACAATILFLYAGVIFALICVFFVLQFYNKPFSRVFFELFLLLPCLFLALHAVFLKNMRLPFTAAYNDYSSAIITGFGLIISIYVLIRERSSLLFRRSQNRSFEEVMHIRANVTNLLVEYCREPADQIASLTQLALSHDGTVSAEDQSRILHSIEDSANILNWHLRNIQEYEVLPGAAHEMQKIRMKLGTVYSYVLKEFGSPTAVLDRPEVWKNLYALGEPYALIRANTQYCSAISPLGAGEPVHISCCPDDGYIRIELSLHIPEANLRKARRICNIMNRGSVFHGVEDEGNMPIYVAHSIFARHGCPPKVQLFPATNGYNMVSQYLIQSWDPSMEREAGDPAAVYSAGSADEKDGRKVIVLLSNSSEEIDLISSYLAFEPYKLQVVTSETKMLQELPNIENLSILIIGCAFLDSSIYSICWMVREHFSLGQLPILLVQRDPDLKTHTAASSLVNGIVTALSNRFEFTQKVKTLVDLQDSVQSTIMSRLAFLQAQMNPHFIFNTINTIMAMCLNKPMEAYNLMGFFAHYLRNSLFSRDLDKPYPVYQEIDLIEAYLSIEKARFEDQIVFEVNSDVSDTTLILPMLIEPLVENSVKHGLHGSRPLKIVVDIREENDLLNISVRDNGAGFRPEKLEQLDTKALPNNRSIGLENVRTRLKLFYNGTLNIESTPGEGACVSFSLKLNRCGNYL